MEAILEVLIAFLAVLGMLALGWLLFGRLLVPAGGEKIWTLIPGKGDGAGLEQAVLGLSWLRGGELLAGRLVIVDCGLDPAGQAIAAALCLRESGVEVCPLSELSVYIKQESL